ncbi:hypothetical protein EV424DRAFT_1353779 [Suillus variegatus]|nr:hypothetical protein EV424DRAFT_1353779 [Suillus variegatus]
MPPKKQNPTKLPESPNCPKRKPKLAQSSVAFQELLLPCQYEQYDQCGNNKTLQDELSIIKAAPIVSVQTQANNLFSLAIKTNLPHNHECINCGVMVYKQYCLAASVEISESKFRYPMYLRIGHGKDKPLCYVFIGCGDVHQSKFLSIMGQSSTVAKSNKTVDHQWKGGQRVLIMISYGPAIMVSHYFEAVKVLVESNLVNFVIGFRVVIMFTSIVDNK